MYAIIKMTLKSINYNRAILDRLWYKLDLNTEIRQNVNMDVCT